MVIFWPKSRLELPNFFFSHNFLVYQLFLQFIIKKSNLKLYQSPYWLQQDHNRIEELPQHACWSWSWGAGLPWHPQIFADQLTLSQPGRQIMPTTLLLAPRILRPSYGPAQSLTLDYDSVNMQLVRTYFLVTLLCKSKQLLAWGPLHKELRGIKKKLQI